MAFKHCLPEMDMAQAAPVLHDFHVNADFIFQLAVKGFIQGAHQVVVVHEIEFILANNNRNGAKPEIVMQMLRVGLVFLAKPSGLDHNLGLTGGKLSRGKIFHAQLVEITSLRLPGTPLKLLVTDMFTHANLILVQSPPLKVFFLSDCCDSSTYQQQF